jgi:hypothetical protein
MTAFPTVEDYREALRLHKYWLTKSQKRIMQLHFRAPHHSMTATEMASALGYDDYMPVNGLYGSLAARLAERMNWPVPQGEPSATSMVIFEREGPEEHWRWVMRPELVEALVSLGW